MSKTDPLSADSIIKWLKLGDCADDIQHLIDAGLAQARKYTGYDYHNNGERVRYIRDWPEIIELECYGSDCENIKWTLDVHENGLWKTQPAEQVGDVLCISPKCDCSCSCISCKGAPQLRLTTRPDCALVRADVILYVRRFVAFHYMNRGDELDQDENKLLKILKPHMRIAFC